MLTKNIHITKTRTLILDVSAKCWNAEWQTESTETVNRVMRRNPLPHPQNTIQQLSVTMRIVRLGLTTYLCLCMTATLLNCSNAIHQLPLMVINNRMFDFISSVTDIDIETVVKGVILLVRFQDDDQIIFTVAVTLFFLRTACVMWKKIGVTLNI